MKKISILLVAVMLISGTAFAATKAPVAKAVTSSSSNMTMAVGSYLLGGFNIGGANGGGSGSSVLKFIGETYTGTVGLNFASINANNATNTYIGLIGIYALNMSGGKIPTHLGVALSFNTVPNNSIFGIGIVYGAETFLLDKVIVGFDVIPLIFSSGNNTTSYGLGTAAVYLACLL